MAERLRDRAGTRSPRPRVRDDLPDEGYLFPGEVARLLRCADIDYHQLRRLFRLVRVQADQPVRARRWARFSLRDVAALRVALDLCGGLQALEHGRRLRIRPVESACEALRSQGVANPLLDVPLHRLGDVVLAEVDGVLFNPVTGQTGLRESRDLIESYLDEQWAGLEEEAKGVSRDLERRDRGDLKKSFRAETVQVSRRKDAVRTAGSVEFKSR